MNNVRKACFPKWIQERCHHVSREQASSVKIHVLYHKMKAAQVLPNAMQLECSRTLVLRTRVFATKPRSFGHARLGRVPNWNTPVPAALDHVLFCHSVPVVYHCTPAHHQANSTWSFRPDRNGPDPASKSTNRAPLQERLSSSSLDLSPAPMYSIIALRRQDK